MCEHDNLQVVLDAGKQLAGLSVDEVAGIPVTIIPAGMVVKPMTDVLEVADRRAPFPRRITGSAILTELSSFTAHVNRFKEEASAIFADTEQTKLTCVFDYHVGADHPRWGEHRAIYTCPLSDEWKAWNENSEKAMGQDDFGQWIDDHLLDLVSADGYPAPAAVLEMARNLVVNTKGQFERKVNVTTGEGSLVCRDEHEATSTKIHRAFLLGIPVFQGGELWKVEARIRFALQGGRPSFCYALYQPGAILGEAFKGNREQAARETGLPIFAGAPE